MPYDFSSLLLEVIIVCDAFGKKGILIFSVV